MAMICLKFPAFLVFCSAVAFSQAFDRARSIDGYIDSLLLADMTWYGLGQDSLPPDTVPPPLPLAPSRSLETGVRDLAQFDTPRELPSYTRAEGFALHFGAGDPVPVWDNGDVRLGLAGSGGFAFGIRKWEWRLLVESTFPDRYAPLRLVLEGHNVIDSRENWKCSDLENTLSAMIAGIDARSVYSERRGASAELLIVATPSIAIGATGLVDDYASTSRHAEWSIFGPAQPFAEVPRSREGRLLSVTPRVAIGTPGDGQGGGGGATYGLDARIEIGEIEGGRFLQATIDGRCRVWPVHGTLSLAAHTRVIVSEGDLPPQRIPAYGGFGSMPSHPLNAYQAQSGSYLAIEGLIRPFLRSRTRLLEDLSLMVTGEWCAIEVPDSDPATRGGIGFYVATATGTIRAGVALPTDGRYGIRFAMRLSKTI